MISKQKYETSSVSKKAFEDVIGTQLSWTDFAQGKTLCGGGKFAAADSMFLIHGYENKLYIRCCGNKKPCLIDEFLEKEFCATCPHRTGFLVKRTSMTHPMGIDLASSTKETYFMPSFPDIYVPTGCPHKEYRSTETDLNAPFRRINARCLHVYDKHTSMFPIAWKVYKDNAGKISLSVQFKEIFVNVEQDKYVNTMFYQNITFDTANGQAYMSDVHNQNRHVKSKICGAYIDNITYTGQSPLFKIPNAVKASGEEWNEALTTLANTITNELYKDSSKAPSFEMPKDAIVADLITSIAAFNRFPNLCGQYPLYNMYSILSVSEKAKIKKLDRRITLPNLYRELNIPMNDVLATLLAEHPDRVCLAYLLANIGCTDPDTIAFGCSDKYYDDLIYALLELIQEIKFEDPIAILSLVAACSVGRGGWAGWFIDIVTASLTETQKPSDIADKIEIILLSGNKLPIERTYANFLESLSDIYVSVVKQSIINMTMRRGNDIFFNRIGEWKLRKYKSNWNVSLPNSDDDYEVFESMNLPILRLSGDIVRKMRVILKKDDQTIGGAELRGEFSFDKRRFNSKKLLSVINGKNDKNQSSLLDIDVDQIKANWYLNDIRWKEETQDESEKRHRRDIVSRWCDQKNISISNRMHKYLTIAT